jgi:hypothetical protein
MHKLTMNSYPDSEASIKKFVTKDSGSDPKKFVCAVEVVGFPFYYLIPISIT